MLTNEKAEKVFRTAEAGASIGSAVVAGVGIFCGWSLLKGLVVMTVIGTVVGLAGGAYQLVKEDTAADFRRAVK